MYRNAVPSLVYRSSIHGVDALDPLTGQSRWSWATGVQHAPREMPVRVLVDRDLLCFLGTLAHGSQHYRALVALDAAQGSLRWTCNLERLYPSAQRQVLLLSCGETLVLTSGAPFPNSVGIARADGRQLWARQEPFPALPVLSCEGQSVYVDWNLLEG